MVRAFDLPAVSGLWLLVLLALLAASAGADWSMRLVDRSGGPASVTVSGVAAGVTPPYGPRALNLRFDARHPCSNARPMRLSTPPWPCVKWGMAAILRRLGWRRDG